MMEAERVSETLDFCLQLTIRIGQNFITPKVHYGVHVTLPPDPILSHINPIYILYVKIHFSIINPSAISVRKIWITLV